MCGPRHGQSDRATELAGKAKLVCLCLVAYGARPRISFGHACAQPRAHPNVTDRRGEGSRLEERRGGEVTGVQTCALPICWSACASWLTARGHASLSDMLAPSLGHTPMSPTAEVRSANLAHHVLAAVGIGNAQGAFRVILPFTIHDEAVVMFSRRQRHRCRPGAVLGFLHRNAALLPVSKITDQQHADSCRCGETKRLLCGSLHLPCHTSLSFPELGLFAEQQWPCLGAHIRSWLRAESSISAWPTTGSFPSIQEFPCAGLVSSGETLE